MTVLAQDNFDSYTNNQSLSGANGGSGWSGGWSVVDTPIVTNTESISSPNSVKLETSGYTNISRVISSIPSKSYCEVYVKVSSYSAGIEFMVYGASNYARVRFLAGGAINYDVNANGSASSNVSTSGTYALNQFVKIGILFDVTSSKLKLYIDNTNIVDITSSFSAGWDTIYCVQPAAYTSYWDSLTIYDDEPNQSVKKLDGLFFCP